MKRLISTVCLALALCLALSAGSLAAEEKVTPLVRSGGSLTLVVKEDGTILGWGDSRNGQLGNGTNKVTRTPAPAALGLDGKDILDIQCGNENALFLMKDGTVFTCGSASHGTQGVGPRQRPVLTPMQIPDLKDIVQITSGFGHNAALDKDGHVWVWGRNDHGQLGLGDRTARNVPVKMELENIAEVHCGGKFTIARDTSGQYWGWGYNDYQVLRASKVKENVLSPIRLTGLDERKYVTFDCASGCAFWLDEEGNVWGRGRNDGRQLGNKEALWGQDPNLSRVAIPEKVAELCIYSACNSALTVNGNVYVWGITRNGQAGHGSGKSYPTPSIAWEHGDAAAVAMGSLFHILLTKDGTIYAVGKNGYCQLGIFHASDVYTWTKNGVNVKE